MRECVRFEFESASDARGFVISVLQEMQDNQGVSVDAFSKRLESFDKRLAFIEGEIKAFKAREKEQEKEITSLQKRIWALEPSADDLKKREQKRVAAVEFFKNRVKDELKSELLEFIKGELATKTDGLKTALAEYESGLKTPQVAEAKAKVQKAVKTPERKRAYLREYYQKNKERLNAYQKEYLRKKNEDEISYAKKHYKENIGYYKEKSAKWAKIMRENRREEVIKSAFKIYRQNKNTLVQGGITEYYFAKLVDIRKKQKALQKTLPMADVEWCLGLVNRFGDGAIKIFKKALDFHAQTGKQPERTFKISNFEKVGIFAENKGGVND